MLHSTVFNTSQVCHQLGITHVVLSPGSRNAPLTVSFARHPEIKKYIVPDERSAAFIALGIAQQTNEPVALCCTSGTALLNYAPAIAEAYYRQIPLVVLSADRPEVLIDQRDGQTIRQFEALKNHVKHSYQLPDVNLTNETAQYESILIEAIQYARKLPKGPVHINIPFSEPFYPTPDQQLSFELIDIEKKQTSNEADEIPDLSRYKKILILIGQQDQDESLDKELTAIQESIPIISSPISNVNYGIQYADGFVQDQDNLQPDVLITSGLSVLSKKLKQYLRKHSPQLHFHFDPSGVEVDTFQTKPRLIRRKLSESLSQLPYDQTDLSYLQAWRGFSEQYKAVSDQFIHECEYSETKIAALILNSLPWQSSLHLSNSMPVRYADLFAVPAGVKVYANRGTSGIDGCTSTAVGTALVSDQLQVLLTGDLAFLYDRNAFFHNYKVPNLRIIVLNNQGGGIFRLIEGPSGLEELEDYFETRHNRTAEYICAENGLAYQTARNQEELHERLASFYEPSETCKVLEVFTDPSTNQRVYKALRAYINEQINN